MKLLYRNTSFGFSTLFELDTNKRTVFRLFLLKITFIVTCTETQETHSFVRPSQVHLPPRLGGVTAELRRAGPSDPKPSPPAGSVACPHSHGRHFLALLPTSCSARRPDRRGRVSPAPELDTNRLHCSTCSSVLPPLSPGDALPVASSQPCCSPPCKRPVISYPFPWPRVVPASGQKPAPVRPCWDSF